MKALFISNDPSIFDASSEARVRMRDYAAAIGELHIVSPAAKDAQEIAEQNLFLHPVRASRLFRIGALAKRARGVIAERGIEVVSAQDPFEQGLAALRAVQNTPAKLHVQVHTDFLSPWFVKSGNPRSPRVRMPLINRLRRRWADKVLPQASGIRVVSARVKSSLAKRYGAAIREPAVIPIRISAELPPKSPLNLFSFTLLAVGRLEPEKRVEDILAALANVVPKYPIVGLAIAGEGRERARLERMVKKLGLGQHVAFLGARADARGLMQSAQGFIQASAYEGYGRTLIEAALAKVPIITTDVGIVGEVLKGYDDVLSAPVADPTALMYHIVGLVEDVATRLALALHAEATARSYLAGARNAPEDIAADLAKALL
ncbi:MAG TPA: glycosyltransferase [Candidatus Paceibacterota bacterium]|nr:glycosyltransferase [Candidatus Paceibacterota bacterium]